VSRAVLWLLAGLAALAVLIVASAPELRGDIGGASGLVLVAFAAGIPGAVVLTVLALGRRGRHDPPSDGA
jgi:hypothetical protein